MAVDPGVPLLILVALVVLAIVAWAGRKRFPLRIGMGNFFRRKTQVAIVVTGLLVGTAIISSSYVIQTTFDFGIRSSVFHQLDLIDELVVKNGPSGGRQPFNASVYGGLRANLTSGALPDVAALAPRYMVSGSAFDNTSSLLEPSTTVIGFNASQDLGTFVRPDGSAWNGSGIGPTDAIVNQAFVNDTEAKVGDLLLAFIGTSSRPTPLTVQAIVLDSGRGALNGGADVFVRLDTVQAVLGTPGQINVITVANMGGATQGYLRTDKVDTQLENALPAALGLSVSNVKSDSVDQATRNVDQLQIFLLLGSFTIVAGVLLIVNIFVMLAEERKGEMGVARALGMRRKHLVQSFVAEGLAYALLSAFVGTFVGLLLAGVIMWAFGLVFPLRFLGGVSFVLTWTALDLIRGFAIGFLITMGTILLASWRVSKLNIVRAIRDIPEPMEHESTRRQLALGVLLVLGGAFLTEEAFRRQDVLFQDLGPSGLAIGLAILTRNYISPRAAFSAAGAFLIGWLLYPNKPINPTSADIPVFVAAGLLMIFGAILLVMFNSEVLVWFASRIGRGRTWRPVVRTAVAYPMNKKFRTGTTLATIALIMFTIATLSGIQSIIGSSITTTVVRQSGGYDLIAQSNPAIPKPDFWTTFNGSSFVSQISEAHGLSWASRVPVSGNATDTGILHNTSFYGVPAEWVAKSIPLELQAIDANYSTPGAVWQALEANRSLAVVDGSVIPGGIAGGFGGGGFFTFSVRLGQTLYYRNATGAIHDVKVIGILYEQFVPGFFVGWDTVASEFRVPLPFGRSLPIDYPSIFYVKVNAGADANGVSHGLERTFLQFQMVVIDLQTLVSQITAVISGVFSLLEAYLALGLIVGIAGLGIITMRNVVERRTETGALRALGFRKSMILKSFLLELAFISGTGILIGDLLGIALSYDIFLKFFADVGSYAVPWTQLSILSALAFIGAVVATASPAIRAARMAPAEALRSYE